MKHFNFIPLLIAAWLSNCLSAAEPVYVEDNGLLVIEAERALAMHPDPEKSAFELRTDLKGYSGPGYLYWNGGNLYGGMSKDVLRYRIHIQNPGRYLLIMHVSSKGAERHDLNNDCWLQMDDGKIYKTFHASTEGWSWGGRFDHHPEGKPPAFYQLGAGEHTLTLSGRSQGFHIDRIHLYKAERAGDAKSLQVKETNSIPAIPKELTNEKIRAAWFAGQLGSVWSWAEKNSEKDPEAESINAILKTSFEQQVQALEDLYGKNPAAAYAQLHVCMNAWHKAPRPAKKQLSTIKKTWSKDKNLKKELKAQGIINTLVKLKQDKSADHSAAIRKGEGILKKDLAETILAKQYFKN